MKNAKLKFLTAALLVIGFASITSEAFAKCSCTGSAPSVVCTYTGKTLPPKTAKAAKVCPTTGKSALKCSLKNAYNTQKFQLGETLRQAKLDAKNALGQTACANKQQVNNYVAPVTTPPATVGNSTTGSNNNSSTR